MERAAGVPSLGVLAVQEVQAQPEPLPPSVGALLEKANAAYRRLDLEAVSSILEGAEAACLEAAPYVTCREFIFNINMVRGMALMASAGTETAAADQAFRSAHIALPTRILDPKLYPPNTMRAFANAWTASETMPRTICDIASKPPRVRVFVDGEAAPGDGAAVSLSPGRHVIEARFLGYEPQYRVVEVASAAAPPIAVRFELTPESDVVAWKNLIREISNPAWQGKNGEISALLNRFQINYVLLLTPIPNGTPGFQADLVSASENSLHTLPELGPPGADVSEAFSGALMDALGIARPAAPPVPVFVDGPLGNDDDDEGTIEGDEGEDEDDLDEDEDPSIRFSDANETEDNGERRFVTVLKSPWLWVSVGIVAAIVTGVVVSTQIED